LGGTQNAGVAEMTHKQQTGDGRQEKGGRNEKKIGTKTLPEGS